MNTNQATGAVNTQAGAATQTNAASAAEVVEEPPKTLEDALYKISRLYDAIAIQRNTIESRGRRIEELKAALAAPAAAIDARGVAELMAMPEEQIDADLRSLGIDPDDAARRAGDAIASAVEIAEQMRIAKKGATCPLCGRSFPHEHSPEEITIYRNGMKAAIDAREQEVPSAEDMVNAAYRLHKYRQGTDRGIAFNQGARWMRKTLASRSEAPEARPNAAGQEQGWMSIATAPKDGSKFLAYKRGTIATASVMVRDDGEIWTFGRSSAHSDVFPGIVPSHWRPLPTPPLEAVGSSGMTADHAQGDKA